eukprot:970538-Alexandrium_andersonii.AAC.1
MLSADLPSLARPAYDRLCQALVDAGAKGVKYGTINSPGLLGVLPSSRWTLDEHLAYLRYTGMLAPARFLAIYQAEGRFRLDVSEDLDYSTSRYWQIVKATLNPTGTAH